MKMRGLIEPYILSETWYILLSGSSCNYLTISERWFIPCHHSIQIIDLASANWQPLEYGWSYGLLKYYTQAWQMCPSKLIHSSFSIDQQFIVAALLWLLIITNVYGCCEWWVPIFTLSKQTNHSTCSHLLCKDTTLKSWNYSWRKQDYQQCSIESTVF